MQYALLIYTRPGTLDGIAARIPAARLGGAVEVRPVVER
jgi:hypothetical protein